VRRKLGALCLALLGGAAFFWFIVMRLLTRWHGGWRCPYAWAWMVDNPFRRWYTRHVLDRTGIRPGEQVLELGPGPGAFTLEAARRTEPGGALIAVDVDPRMVADLMQKVQGSDLSVRAYVADAHSLPLDDESIDRAFVVTVLAEIPDPVRALIELRRVLRSDGVLSITEEFLDPDYPLPRTTIRWAEQAGFELAERHGGWWLYTLNFVKR